MSNQEEIIEGNKILAEFEGYKYYPHPNKDAGWRKENGHLKLGKSYYLARTHKHLKYHSDYNDLMRVWFKFKDLDTSKMLPIEILKYKYLRDCVKEYLVNGNIENLFLTLRKSIIWYNSVKKNEN